LALVNGNPHTLPDGTTLATVVASVTDRSTGVAAAVNGAVVPRAAWSSTPVANGDEVEILTAVQGG
jgi:sulfur carrier protein